RVIETDATPIKASTSRLRMLILSPQNLTLPAVV
ncbi:MAG: hypothetical protein AVDCRST_MAG64-1592, partial [uncultured Phycisphaerae bacterium]